jgi:hypothetical protein
MTITLNLPDALDPKALCPACKDAFTITKDKRIHAHGIRGNSMFGCPGSGLTVSRVVVDALVLEALMNMAKIA